MKRLIPFFLMLCLSTTAFSQFGFVTDPMDHSYNTLTLGNSIWLTKNLFYDNGQIGVRCLNEDAFNCEIEGYLYSFERASSICNELGEGWHLPSVDEFKSIAIHGYLLLNASVNAIFRDTIENVGNPQLSYDYLKDGGLSGFNATLAGTCQEDGSISSGAYGVDVVADSSLQGIYWTYKVENQQMVPYTIQINRQFGGVVFAPSEDKAKNSVRCVKKRPKLGLIAGNNVNMHTSPQILSDGSNVLGQLMQNMQVEILGVTPANTNEIPWYKVKIGTTEGWIRSDLVLRQ